MPRRKLFLLTVMTIVLAGGPAAFADRLGGAYRGPEEASASKETSESSSSSTGTEGPQNQGGGGGSSGDSGGGGYGDGGGGGDSGGGGGGDSGGGGGGDSGGGGGGDSGGGGGGGGDSFGGGGGGGQSARGGGSLGGGGGGAPGGGGAVGGGGAAGSGTDRLSVVAWYFEHNREQFLAAVNEARNRRVRAPKGSVAERLSLVPRDHRQRSGVTVDDRAKIVDLLKKSTLAAEDVVRDAAVIALGKVGSPDAVKILLTRLEEESKWDIKEDVVLALGIARTPEAIDALEATLKGNRTRLHPYALLALGVTQNPERAGPVVLDYFQQVLKRPRADDVLASAALALGALRYEKAEPALIAAVKAKATPELARIYITQALGRLGTEESRRTLEGLVDHDREDVARAALLALGNYADPAVLKVLAGKQGIGRADQLAAGFAAVSLGRVLDHLSEADRKKAPDEIREIALNPAKARLKSQYANLALCLFDGGIDADVRKRYTEELRTAKTDPEVLGAMAMACGVASVQGFEGSFSDIAEKAGADNQLRGYAALALGMTGSGTKTADTLKRVYADTDDFYVQRGAVLGLGFVGDRRDVKFLCDVIVKTDKDKAFATYTRGAAVMALGLIRDGDSVGQIQNLLRQPDPHVRAYAIAALGHIADKDPTPVLPKIFEHCNFRQEFHALKVALRTL